MLSSPFPMAVAHCSCATIFFVRPLTLTYSTTHRFRLKPILASSISTSFPTKRINRKNYLRPKILRTLTKPFPTAPFPEIETFPTKTLVPITTPPEKDAISDTQSDGILGEIVPAGDADKVEEFRFSETINNSVEYSGNVGKISAWSVLKFGGYLVGVLVFAVWVLGYKSSDKQERTLNNLDNQGNVLLNGNGNVGYIDETQLEGKINEIRAMARVARESERRESNDGNEESDIEKEIGARLAKLENRLNSKRDKLPASYIKYLGLFGNLEDDYSKDSLDSKEENKTLMFKKKLRFKSSSLKPSNNPKGFLGLKDGRGSNIISGDGPKYGSKQNDLGSMKIDSGTKAMTSELNSSHHEENNLRKKRASLPKEIVPGDVKETRKRAGKSRDLETKNSRSLAKEIQKATLNGSRDAGKRSVASNGDKKSGAETDLWWLNLPYVLAILMRRGSEQEEPGGFYTLRVTSQADDLGDSAYTVAFEDRGDANNFCYLLESFFEDLGDFSADIVPLSIKELHEAVQSHSKKVIVVKKGQLNLYVGQPLAEVEMALCSLLEQNQIT